MDKDGNMVEIKPHKDFRLFLTMDPKNGEISRAMRNRGLEIFLLNEDGSVIDDFDTRALINKSGLKSNEKIEALIGIIKENSKLTGKSLSFSFLSYFIFSSYFF